MCFFSGSVFSQYKAGSSWRGWKHSLSLFSVTGQQQQVISRFLLNLSSFFPPWWRSVLICLFFPLTSVRNCCGRHGNPHAKYLRFPSKCWTPQSFRTTSTSTSWTGLRWTCSASDLARVSTCGVPAQARCACVCVRACHCCKLFHFTVYNWSSFIFFALDLSSVSAGDTAVRPLCWRRFRHVCGLVGAGRSSCRNPAGLLLHKQMYGNVPLRPKYQHL